MAFDSALLLFWLKKLASMLLLPPLGPLLLIAAGLVAAMRWRRAGLVLAWSGVVLAVFVTSPTGVSWLLRGLETAPVLTAEAARTAQAIVVLGGGKRRNAPEYGGETVNRLSLERLRYGARLARETGLPVLVAGGAPSGGVPEAELMQATMETDFGVPVRWAESGSRDTRENAQLSARILQAAGVQRIVLVTHAAHMTRAQVEFEAQGLEVLPAPTAWQGGFDTSDQVLSLLPGATSAYAGWYATHEWIGRLAYRLSR